MPLSLALRSRRIKNGMGLFPSKAHVDRIEELRLAFLVYDSFFFFRFGELLVARGIVKSGPGVEYEVARRLYDAGVRTKCIHNVIIPDYKNATGRCKWIRRSLGDGDVP